jgi:hypothetical protein
VLAGRRTVEQIDHWGGDAHGVPIFVPSHRPPGPSVANYPLVTYVLNNAISATPGCVRSSSSGGMSNCAIVWSMSTSVMVSPQLVL